MDLLCENYKRAAENRERVDQKYGESYYIWLENFLRSYPKKKPLPYWIPQGNLPAAGKKDIDELHRHGIWERE